MTKMSPMKQLTSSGTETDPPRHLGVDDRKRKRMISNRESARRSRMKKQQHVDALVGQVSQLNNENKVIEEKINGVADMYVGIASQNNVLRTQLAELADRLRSLNTVLQIAEEVSGFEMDIPEIPESLLEPWQLPCPASTSMFQC